jgi:hypothetical protein
MYLLSSVAFRLSKQLNDDLWFASLVLNEEKKEKKRRKKRKKKKKKEKKEKNEKKKEKKDSKR